MISVWDGNEKVAKRVDLWTKEMMVDEMKYFHFQTLMTLADSLEQSTKENVVAEKMRKFGMQIGKEMDILTK
jgi:gliding motility-associated protein GldC